MVWCEELVHHVPLFVDLCEEYDQARYVNLPLRTVSRSWWCGVRNWSPMSHCLLTSVRNMIRPIMSTYLYGQFLGPDGVVWGTGPPCPTVCWPLWGIWSGQLCLPTSKDSFWVLMVWCEELVNHIPLFIDLCEEYDQARYVYLPLRTVSGPGGVVWGTGPPCPTVCWPLWGIWSGQICLLTSKDSFWVLMVWCEELVNHIPLFVDLCEEYDQARYVYLPLRTVSGSWWCGVRNWSTISHCLLTSVRNMIRPDMSTYL